MADKSKIIPDSEHCNKTYFTCGRNISQCIPLQWICDNEPDCSDGSDESEDLCKNAGDCGGNFTAAVGFIYSPSYPENYPGKKTCIYTISRQAGTAILLNFLSIDTYMRVGYKCLGYKYMYTDFIELRDGPSKNSPLLARLCGSEIPALVQSIQNHLWIK